MSPEIRIAAVPGVSRVELAIIEASGKSARAELTVHELAHVIVRLVRLLAIVRAPPPAR